MSNKLTTLSHLKMALTRTAAEDAKLLAMINEVVADVEGLITTGGEANVLEGVKVNGAALPIAEKMVDILIAAGTEDGTISVNGANVAVTGLKALAYKAQISESDLDDALKAVIAAKASQADLSALTVRVGNIESAGYQNAEQVQTAIQAAISASGHAHFEEVDEVPAASEAEENVMYLVMNSTTGHYDIYAKVGNAVVLLDDTTVDLSGYSTTEAMQAYVTQQITALNVGQYATDGELAAAVERITALETALANYYTKDEAEAKFTDETEAQTIAENAVAAATATDEEVSSMLDEVFGAEE